MKSKSASLGSEHLFNEKYTIKEKKGGGGTAKAFLVLEKKTQKEYIAKIIEDYDNYKREIKIYEKLNAKNNPNIIKMIDHGIGYIQYERKQNYIILEYAPNRELFDYVVYAGEGFGESNGKVIFAGILNGMKCLHDSKIAHNDLSMSNIFLDKDFNPKVGDFGAASDDIKKIKNVIGTPGFVAPEKDDNKKYDIYKADIFSLGAILIYLVFGKRGFQKAIKKDILYNLIIENTEASKTQYWNKMGLCLGKAISKEFIDLYIKMVSPYPDKRPNIKTILEQPWIKSIENLDINKIKDEIKERCKEKRKIIEKKVKKEIQDDEDKIEYKIEGMKLTTRASKEDKIGNFNSNSNPKDFPDYYNDEFCVKINNNFNGNKLMNNLYDRIINKFGTDKCFIKPVADKFKMDITFEVEDESLEIKIKLYSFKNGLKLKFFRKNGRKESFFEIFKDISELVKI